MKNSFRILLLCLFLLCGLTACGSAPSVPESTAPKNTAPETEQTSAADQTTEPSEPKKTDSEPMSSERMIQLTAEDVNIVIRLYDTPTANALYEQLPMKLEFSDFNSTEKIAYLPEALPTEGEPDGCEPKIGDFCLYAPWGNLSLFYQDFRYSESLILLGTVESGMDSVSKLDHAGTVSIQAVSENG